VAIATVDMDIAMNTYMSSTCYMSIYMLHVHVYAAVHVHAGCPCPYCMSQYMRRTISMLHAYVFTACHVLLHVHVRAAWI
jgi:hypothetical protein